MRISVVNDQCGISSETLRYYERIGLLPPVNRSGSGLRDYNELDAQRVEFIKCMRSAGLPIEVSLEYFNLIQQGDQTVEARKAILVEQRNRILARMAEMREILDLLNHKIDIYENAVLKTEKAIVE